jgi:hypothetical protein
MTRLVIAVRELEHPGVDVAVKAVNELLIICIYLIET